MIHDSLFFLSVASWYTEEGQGQNQNQNEFNIETDATNIGGPGSSGKFSGEPESECSSVTSDSNPG